MGVVTIRAMEIVNTDSLVALDKAFVWHPFTQMRSWTAEGHEPLLLVSGKGAWLQDGCGRRYLDGNSSIWTNIHGHRHPAIDAALKSQLDRVAHTSFLGFTNPLAAELAARLVALLPGSPLKKVFYSDDGSTGIEVAIKMAIQFFLQNGQSERIQFVSFENAYHGDTLGASSLGGIGMFHDRFRSHQFPVIRLKGIEDLDTVDGANVAAVVIEPLIQGSSGMRLWPQGMLRELRKWCDEHGAFLIFDEVMTGFGRTGKMFACMYEGVFPDFLVMAKGLTGGYLPLGATLTTQPVFEGFLGTYSELRTFFYGHSYTGNALGCAAALANLQIFEEEQTLEALEPKIVHLRARLNALRASQFVREIRQCGFIAGIELGGANREALDWRAETGAKVCVAARKYGLLTRPIRDVIVLMLPLCVSTEEIDLAVEAIGKAIVDVCA
jgi:adenosylmethionine---8-amino-7-oxononanoate aminotransferase